MWAKRKFLTGPIRTIPPPIPLHQRSPWCRGRVQDKRSRGPRFKPQCGQKENLSQVQSEQYHHQSLCTRDKYLKLSEVKTRSCHGTVVEYRTRDPEFLGSNPSVAKKKISHRSNQNNTSTNPSAPEKLSEVKPSKLPWYKVQN